MTRQTLFTLACIGASAVTIAVLLWQRKSFGAYTERIERSNTITRQSCELTRQSNGRVIDEIAANTRESELARELVDIVRQELLNQRSA